MKSFPHTDAYFVLFPNGGSGNFICNMLGQLYYQTHINVSDRGDAHARVFPHNYEKQSWNLWGQLVMGLKVNACDIIKPEDPNKPIFFVDHFIKNFDTFFERYPKGKLLIITSTDKDILRMRICVFIKTYFKNHDEKNYIHDWEVFTQKHVKFKKDPKTFTEEDYKDLIELAGNITTYYNEFDTDKEIYFLPYEKIISDMDYTLNLLSKITNKPVTDDIRSDYAFYLKKQEEILNKYTPWLLNPQSHS